MSEQLVHAVLDIETLGITESAVVLSIGAAAFRFGDKADYDKVCLGAFHAKINVREQITQYGRTTDQSTLDWWKQQSEAAKEILKPTPIDHSVEDACLDLVKWLDKVGFNARKSYVFSRGNHFDFPKIESLFVATGVPLPYNNWKVRDVRTYIDILSGTDDGYYTLDQGIPSNFVAHHAMHDAAHDATKILEIYTKASEG